MGIKKVGRQGEPFDERVLRKIAAFRNRHAETPIQVDGAVTLETAPALLDAGVSRLIVGHGIWQADNVEAALHAYQALAEEYGIYEK